MGMKEDWQNYMQRREARAYFRSNNTEILNTKDYMMVTLISFGMMIAGSLVISLTGSILSIRFGFLYWLTLLAAITLIQKTIQKDLDVLAKIIIGLAYIFQFVMVYVMQYALNYGMMILFDPSIYSLSIHLVISGIRNNLFTLVIGLAIIYVK